MVWIEMSRDKIHGGGEWSFPHCVWAPTYKNEPQKGRWSFWSNILEIKTGDVIIHLRGIGDKAAFVGFSVAETDGHKTMERPPCPGKWEYCESYFRALLTNYKNFATPINLHHFFNHNQESLLIYLSNLPKKNKNCFLVRQSNRLQCLNGAYLSACDDKLFELITGESIVPATQVATSQVSTSEVRKAVLQRCGQTQFSDAVKNNYSGQCCFPDCQINDRRFLVGSHIARWVDNPEKRGNVSNGLCLCAFHDKAFEAGYFSLDNNYKIIVSKKLAVRESEVFQTLLLPFAGKQIALGVITPDNESLAEHRFRCEI